MTLSWLVKLQGGISDFFIGLKKINKDLERSEMYLEEVLRLTK